MQIDTLRVERHKRRDINARTTYVHATKRIGPTRHQHHHQELPGGCANTALLENPGRVQMPTYKKGADS